MSENCSERRCSVLLDDPAFSFDAAHFVAFPAPARSGDRRWFGEPIHGHDFRAVVRVDGPLDSAGAVVDFCAARRALIDVVAPWNHRLFLARRTPCVDYRTLENDGLSEIEIFWRGAPTPRRWVFPQDDVVWLDAPNATAETIAAVLLDAWIVRLVAEKTLAFAPDAYRFSLRLQEAPGSFAEVVSDSFIRQR